MTTQRYDIEVRDMVSRAIRTELEGIGRAAKATEGMLSSMTREMGRATTASKARAAAVRSTSAANTKAAIDEQKLATAVANTAAAEARAETAALNLAARRRKEADATKEATRATRDLANAQREITGAGRIPSTGNPYPFGKTKGNKATAALQTEGMRENVIPDGLSDKLDDVAKKGAKTAGQFKAIGKEGRLARHHLLNLGFQLQDVGVGLASGQKPMTVFLQQGAQIYGIAQQAETGLLGLSKAALGMVVPFLPAIAVAAALTAGLAVLNNQMNKGVGEEELTKGLNLTAEEMKELEDVSITWGDTMLGLWDLVADGIWNVIGPAVTEGKESFTEWFEQSTQQSMQTFNQIIRDAVGAYNAVTDTWRSFPSAIADIFISAVNYAIEEINTLIRAGVDGVNSFLAEANAILPEFAQFGMLEAGQIATIANSHAGAAAKVGEVWKTSMANADRDYMGQFFSAWTGAAADRARGRLGAQADGIRGDRAEAGGTGRNRRAANDNGASDAAKEAAKRAKAIADVNRELDSEIGLLGYYGPELERVSKFMAIQNGLMQKGITLHADEAQAIKDKILVLQEGARVQDALNGIEQAAREPRREYEAQLKAIDIALSETIISEAEATRQRNLAVNAYYDATDGAQGYANAIANLAQETALYGKELAAYQLAQTLFQEAIAAGEAAYDTDSAADYTAEARQQLTREDYATTFESIDPESREDPTGSAYILDEYKNLYSEIDRLRQEDLISEEEASRRKVNLERAHLDARLEHTSTILGQLTQLQSAKSKEIAAIGKAAAIAQATIDGYRAVQAALVGPPGPPWSFAIAGVTGAMAAANVAKIAGVGFMKGGYTGDIPVDSVAGTVHGGEYVFDAAATRSIGVPALEAMRQGARLSPTAANDGGVNIKMVAMPGVVYEERKTSQDEIEMIARRVTREEAPKAVSADMRKGPNSPTNKALRDTTGIKQARAG